MAVRDDDQAETFGSFWDALRKQALCRDLNGTGWYEKAKELAHKAGKSFISSSTFDNWINNRRKGKNYWPWDGDVQFIVKAAVGTDEKDWKPWEERWKAIPQPRRGRKKAAQGESKSSPGLGKWLTRAAIIIGLIAALSTIYVNFFRDSSESESGRSAGGTHATTSSPASPSGRESGCRGQDCAGKDPKDLECDKDEDVIFSEALAESYQGVIIRVKRSEACQAIWGKMTGGTVGDMIEIFGGGGAQRDTVIQYDDKYTPMLPISDGMRARVCVSRKNEERHCSKLVPVEASN
ncbi:MAG: DUF2690 domain-containing protein [Actinophytocola sp.]|uniref:DUF2690 domain-containing protein n=1 Tax=Actinophytocola sp. TaxID=1872138 RepID=UPI003C71E526